MREREKLDVLLGRWEAGECTPEEVSELASHLKQRNSRREAWTFFVNETLIRKSCWSAVKRSRLDAVLDELSVPENVTPFPGRWQAWGRRAAAVAAALVLAISLVWLATRNSPRMLVQTVSGAVSVQRGSSRFSALPKTILRPGDVVETGASGHVVLGYRNEKTTLEVSSNASITIARADGKLLEPRSGLLRASVASQKSDSPLRFRTRQGEATIVGTKFDLLAAEASTRLSVTEGAVQLIRNAPLSPLGKMDSTLVTAGHFAVLAEGVEVAARETSAAAEFRSPVPLKIQFFSSFDRSGAWNTHDGVLEQTVATDGTRNCVFGPAGGTFQLEAVADLRSSTTPAEAGDRVGAGLGFNFGKRLVHWNLYFIQSNPDRAEIGIGSAPEKIVATTLLIKPRGNQFHLKLRAEPLTPERGRVRGKFWEIGEEEPRDWMVSAEVAMSFPVSEMRFSTLNTAGAFQAVSADLTDVEE
jgi:hypothetical protein